MSTEVRQGVVRRAARAVLRRCSFRSFFAAAAAALLALVPMMSAGPAVSSIAMLPYAPQYPHQAYGYGLAFAGRGDREAGQWVSAAHRALFEPQPVELPFRKLAERATGVAASGYAFTVPVGRRVSVRVASDEASAGELFVDLFQVSAAKHERVAGAFPGGGAQPVTLDALEGGDYVLRVQPLLGAAASYGVEIAASPVLKFPVVGVDDRAIWSAFGAERDGGRRAHRGVDIFASRGTPVLAATDGWVTRVETTRVGGNVVWLQPLFGSMRLYYAHLHEQWVEPGDFVVAGQPLGSVGNTGNAITTPPHLHFGVYVRRAGVRGGARDPAEFLR
jgi:hypothetical protein